MEKSTLTRRILLLALLARVIVFAAAGRGMFLIGEGRTQADLAMNLLQGRGFMLSADMLHPSNEASAPQFFRDTFEFYRRVDGYYGAMRPERPTIFLVPGYAFFMAGVFAVFGPNNFLAVSGIQLILGLLTVLIGLRIAQRFLSGRYMLLAGLFFALNPFELYYEALPATQALFSLLFLCSILFTLRLFERVRDRGTFLLQAAMAGVSWAAAFYIRPVAIPVMVWAALLLPMLPLLTRILGGRNKVEKAVPAGLFSVRGFSAGLTMLGLFAIMMLPWGLRNMKVTGEFRIMPAQGGVNIWEYNGRIFTDHFQGEIQGATLLYSNLRHEYMGKLESPELAAFPEFRDEPEWVRDSILYDRNIRFMMANPGLTLRLITLRFVELFKPFPLNAFSPLYTIVGLLFLFWVLFFLWGGAVLCALNRGPEGFFLATLVAGYSLMHLLTASGTPHRVAIDFPMAILAAGGLEYSVRRYSAWRERNNG